jgi:hypothetical protein
VDEQRPRLATALGRALDVNLRYTAVLGKLAARTFDLLVSTLSEFGPQVVSIGSPAQSQQLSAAPAVLAAPAARSPASILLEGETGTRAFGLFVVENSLPQPISTSVEVGPLIDPTGREIRSVLRFEPGIITLAPYQQVVAKVSADISRALVPGVRYQAEMWVPGIPAAKIGIAVRRRPSDSGNGSRNSNRASPVSHRSTKPMLNRRTQNAPKA